MKHKDNGEDILDCEGDTVNYDSMGHGKVAVVRYKKACCNYYDTWCLEPKQELLLLEHIEYAVAYGTVNKSEYQI